MKVGDEEWTVTRSGTPETSPNLVDGDLGTWDVHTTKGEGAPLTPGPARHRYPSTSWNCTLKH